MRRALVALFFASTLLAPNRLSAAPQGHVALRTGACGVGEDGALWQATRFCNGFFADLLFGRRRNADFGVGPYLEITSAGFWDARYGGGASLLAPISADFPLLVSFGLYGHELESAALGGSVFFGARGYNFHGNYNLSFGVFAAASSDLGASHATVVTFGLELDGFLLAAPFLLAAAALR